MSNVTLFNPGQLPDFVKAAGPSALASMLAGGSGGKRISIKGGVFRLYAQGKEVAAIEDRYLDVVVVNAAPHISRTFYLKKWDSENPAAPDCWSADGRSPDKTAANKQSDSCATCTKNIKGSGEGDSRACRYNQRLAVVLANDIEGDVLQLQVPAKSIFGEGVGDSRPLQAYARYLATQKIGPELVVTRLKFDTDSESPKLFFKPMRWLTADEYTTVQAQGKTPEAIDAITMTVAAQEGIAPAVAAPVEDEAPAPAPKAKKAAPKVEDDEPPPPAPKAKKAAPVADDDETPPPTSRKAETPKPSSGKPLADVIAEWDD
jgi:hypothetical protein